jgi:polyferredoxin
MAKMKRRSSRAHIVRILTELAFLVLFGFLFLKGSIQLWLGVFVGGAILSVFFSRLFCGWICPMNTVFRPITWLRARLGIRALKTPGFLTHPAVRYIFLGLFLASMALTKKLGIDLHMPALVFILSIPVVLLFEEALWHNIVCPYGTILSISSRKASTHYRVDGKKCVSCGKCQPVCPVHSIDSLETGKRFIRKADCITCGACAKACPTKAIRLGR